jgi:hypothetical protein
MQREGVSLFPCAIFDYEKKEQAEWKEIYLPPSVWILEMIEKINYGSASFRNLNESCKFFRKFRDFSINAARISKCCQGQPSIDTVVGIVQASQTS